MAPNVFPVTPSTPNSSQKNRSRAAPWNPKISAARKARLPELLGNPLATIAPFVLSVDAPSASALSDCFVPTHW